MIFITKRILKYLVDKGGTLAAAFSSFRGDTIALPLAPAACCACSCCCCACCPFPAPSSVHNNTKHSAQKTKKRIKIKKQRNKRNKWWIENTLSTSSWRHISTCTASTSSWLVVRLARRFSNYRTVQFLGRASRKKKQFFTQWSILFRYLYSLYFVQLLTVNFRLFSFIFVVRFVNLLITSLCLTFTSSSISTSCPRSSRRWTLLLPLTP